MIYSASAPKIRQFIINFQFQCSRILNFGLLGIGIRLIKKMVSIFLAILLLPFSIVLYFFGIRRLNIFIDRIGHLVVEPDTLLKAQQLGLIKQKRWVVLAPRHRVANKHMLKYWEPYFSVIHSTLGCYFFYCISLWPFMRYDVSHFINNSNGPQWAYRVNTLWGNRPPVLSLTLEDNNWAESQFSKLGIPKNSWFVCVHVREGGFSPVDEVLHSHRNGRIENIISSLVEITRRGGWVVRLGDPTMQPLIAMPNVIDYAHHPMRSERLDIVLCARARFILGNTSGMFLVGTVFGVPSALANMVPLPTLGFSSRDLSIPKLYWIETERRYLSFSEVMNSAISTYRYAALYKKSNITVEENSSEDILSLTTEMLDRLEGKFEERAEDFQLHSQYISLFNSKHYSYGASAKMQFLFLRKYRYLLQN